MDIQDRIIVNKSGGEEIYFLSEIASNEIIFSFKEFEKVTLELKSDISNFIEFEYANEDQLKELHNGESIVLNDYEYDRDSSDNNTFYPSKYYIGIKYQGKKLECYFNVASNALGNRIEDIRRIVNDFSKGLELDLFNNNKGKEIIDSNINNYIPLYDKIVNSEKMLQFEMDYIIKHPIENLEKNIKFTQKSTKVTKKQVRYEIKKSINLYSGKKTIQEKKGINLKNRENYVLKRSIKKIIRACEEINKYFEITIDKIDENLSNQRQQLEEITKKKKSLNIKRHDQRYQKRICAEFAQVNESICKLIFEKENLQDKRIILNRIRNNFSSIIVESWMDELNDVNSLYDYTKLIKNVHYKKIIDFVKSINTNFDETHANGIYAYKRTSKLYEIYVLILVFKIFEKKGYKFEFESNHDLNLLFENQEYIFTSEEKLIKVIYDKTVRGTDEWPKDELANQNSANNKPDIVIMIYENNVIKNCVILEVKCRRKNNIYVRTGDTPVFSQLKDYTNFWYFDLNGKLNKNIIDRVYAIFPQEDPYKQYLNANQICLLSLKPVYNYVDDPSYLNLFDELAEYI